MAELPFFCWNAAYRHVPFPGLPRRKTSLGVGFTIDIMGKDSRYGYLCFLSKCCESPQAS